MKKIFKRLFCKHIYKVEKRNSRKQKEKSLGARVSCQYSRTIAIMQYTKNALSAGKKK